MKENYILIRVDTNPCLIQGWNGEKLEDELADFLARNALSGKLTNGGTGNDVVFPREKEDPAVLDTLYRIQDIVMTGIGSKDTHVRGQALATILEMVEDEIVTQTGEEEET